ncbi:LOW QUALITY PROTEIN: hypothetical protein OSB04_001494 [Centaurea solstitialis]|uniref:tRNA-splicing endonuclease subunit Sen54 N-terminal domain-containing protein n=1 Tax=Centaurea solstitialis TaxID=347529 RepID=A0AA38TR32_9ASTR|nr:LOW QUALITY PROTEIN: hypothetical protein OSB04_001494 [Centaurea solstitialis]
MVVYGVGLRAKQGQQSRKKISRFAVLEVSIKNIYIYQICCTIPKGPNLRFLAEIGALHLLDDEDKCIPLEDIYKKVAKGIGGSSWESFEVYRHLKSLGYIIKRHGVCWSMKRNKSVPASVEIEPGSQRIINNGNDDMTSITETMDSMQINELKPVFDVYPPNNKFRKSNSGNPLFVLCISTGNPPTKREIKDIDAKCEGIPVKFCYVEHGRVSFFAFNQIRLPFLKTSWKMSFGEDVSWLIKCRNGMKLYRVSNNMLTDKMAVDLNVFCALMKDIIMSNLYGTIVVAP